MAKNPKLWCVVCRAEIAPERLLRYAPVTCSHACATELVKRRRAHLARTKCGVCGSPSTPEERREFNAWRKARGDKKKRGRKPKYPVPDPRQYSIPPEEITVQ